MLHLVAVQVCQLAEEVAAEEAPLHLGLVVAIYSFLAGEAAAAEAAFVSHGLCMRVRVVVRV